MKHLKRNIATADCSDFATASRHSYATAETQSPTPRGGER